MANKVPVLNKLARNLEMLGQVVSRGSDAEVIASGMTVSYVSASIASPMGGVSDASSPFLGIGIAAPGKLKIKGAAGENSIAAIFTSAADLAVLAQCAHFANNILVEAGDTATQLAEIAGHADLLGMGE
jgi:hypothetical protein